MSVQATFEDEAGRKASVLFSVHSSLPLIAPLFTRAFPFACSGSFLFPFSFFPPPLPSLSVLASPLFLSSSPLSLMTSANPQDRVSSNPTSPNTTLSSTENSAFFAEPDFSKSKPPASPTLETAMLDIKTSLPKETDSPLKSTAEDPTEAKMTSPSAPLSPVAASATSPLLTPAQTTVKMSIETTILDDSHDTDIQFTEGKVPRVVQLRHD